MPNQITPAQTFNKYENVIIVQEYVAGYGWQDSCAEENSRAAKATLADYRDAGVSARVVRRRELAKDAFLCQALLNFCRDFYRSSVGVWPESVEVLKANGKVKFTLSLSEIYEVLGRDSLLVEA